MLRFSVVSRLNKLEIEISPFLMFFLFCFSTLNCNVFYTQENATITVLCFNKNQIQFNLLNLKSSFFRGSDFNLKFFFLLFNSHNSIFSAIDRENYEKCKLKTMDKIFNGSMSQNQSNVLNEFVVDVMI